MLPPGTTYVPQYVSSAKQLDLLGAIDEQPWSCELWRRVQHYGFRYDYMTRVIGPTDRLGRLPAWTEQLAARLVADGHMSSAPDQIIVNEYLPGQGIGMHVDSTLAFGPTIASISLGCPCIMEFTELHGPGQASIWLEPGSLIVLKDDARYLWKHGIPVRDHDVMAGGKVPRGRRVSITVRNVLPQNL